MPAKEGGFRLWISRSTYAALDIVQKSLSSHSHNAEWERTHAAPSTCRHTDVRRALHVHGTRSVVISLAEPFVDVVRRMQSIAHAELNIYKTIATKVQ